MRRASSLITTDNVVERYLDDTYTDVVEVSKKLVEIDRVSSGILDGTFADVTEVVTDPFKTNINTVAGQSTEITNINAQVVPNIAEILLADDNAATATTKAGEASTSAVNAATSEANAAISATTATTQAGISTTKAGEAATSAANALTSETNAAASAASIAASAATIQANSDKLATVETGATADQTAAEIKTLYESNLNTNVFTDNEQSKLTAIEDGATADQTPAEIKSAYESNADTNAYTDAEKVLVSTAEQSANKGVANGYASLDEAGLVPAAQLPSYVDDVVEVATYASLPVTGTEGFIYIVVADETSGGNTSSYRWTGTVYAMVSNTLTASDIEALYEGLANTNKYTDTEKTKLATIETNAKDDQTADEVPVTASGNLTSTNVQAALVELQGDVDTINTNLTTIFNRDLGGIV